MPAPRKIHKLSFLYSCHLSDSAHRLDFVLSAKYFVMLLINKELQPDFVVDTCSGQVKNAKISGEVRSTLSRLIA
jgi:hypothetical protein